MNSIIKCEHPVIIVNPNLPQLVRSGYNKIIYIDNVFDVDVTNIITKEVISTMTGEVKTREKLNLPFLKVFRGYNLKDEYIDDPLFVHLPKFIASDDLKSELVRSLYTKHYKKYFATYDVDPNTLDNYKIVSGTSFEPLFFAVPCGRCSICRQHSTNVLKTRCELEFASSTYVPYFVTLTFDNMHYPTDFSRATQTDILQRFFKRLRRCMDYRDLRTDFRYFAVSEYGSLHHRFHYHIVFYNVAKELNHVAWNKRAKRVTSDFYKVVDKCWQQGNIDVRTIDLTKGTNPISYVCKYLRKQSDETYNWKSIYLGKETILRYKDNVIANFRNESFNVKNEYTGKTVEIPMYSFIKRIVSPNLSRSLPLNVRETLFKGYRLFTYLFDGNKRKFEKDELFGTFKKYHIHYLPLYIRLGYTEIKDYNNMYNIDLNKDFIHLVDDLIDTYEALRSYNLDVDKLYKEHDFYEDNIIVTNTMFDVTAMRDLIERNNNALISQSIDGQ